MEYSEEFLQFLDKLEAETCYHSLIEAVREGYKVTHPLCEGKLRDLAKKGLATAALAGSLIGCGDGNITSPTSETYDQSCFERNDVGPDELPFNVLPPHDYRAKINHCLPVHNISDRSYGIDWNGQDPGDPSRVPIVYYDTEPHTNPQEYRYKADNVSINDHGNEGDRRYSWNVTDEREKLGPTLLYLMIGYEGGYLTNTDEYGEPLRLQI